MKLKPMIFRIQAFVLSIFCAFGFLNLNVHAVRNLKVIVVGDPKVGKTTLINGLCSYGELMKILESHTVIHRFFEDGKLDYNIDFCEINLPVEELEALQESDSRNAVLCNSNIALIVFDLSEGNTLEKGRIQRYKEVVKRKSPQNLVIFIPNKLDLIASKSERDRLGMPIAEYAVECERENKYGCKNQDMECFPTSARDVESLKELADDLCEKGVSCIRAFEESSSASSSSSLPPNVTESTREQLINDCRRQIEEKDNEIAYTKNKLETLKQEKKILESKLKSLEPKKKTFFGD